jgi:hypothetical protein
MTWLLFQLWILMLMAFVIGAGITWAVSHRLRGRTHLPRLGLERYRPRGDGGTERTSG